MALIPMYGTKQSSRVKLGKLGIPKHVSEWNKMIFPRYDRERLFSIEGLGNEGHLMENKGFKLNLTFYEYGTR